MFVFSQPNDKKSTQDIFMNNMSMVLSKFNHLQIYLDFY